jgi:hypothetical protein
MGHIVWLPLHEFWALMQLNDVHLHLHGAEQKIVLCFWNMNGLMNRWDGDFIRSWVGNHTPGQLTQDRGI